MLQVVLSPRRFVHEMDVRGHRDLGDRCEECAPGGRRRPDMFERIFGRESQAPPHGIEFTMKPRQLGIIQVNNREDEQRIVWFTPWAARPVKSRVDHRPPQSDATPDDPATS